MERFFVFLGFTWRVAANVVATAIVLYILSRLQGRIELIIVSILGLIYATIRTIAFNQGFAGARVVMALARDLNHIKSLLGEQQDPGMEAEEIALNRQLIKGYIDLAFLALISLACLVTLFTAI